MMSHLSDAKSSEQKDTYHFLHMGQVLTLNVSSWRVTAGAYNLNGKFFQKSMHYENM